MTQQGKDVPQFSKKLDKKNLIKNLGKRYKLVTHLDKFLANEPVGFKFEYKGKELDDAWHPSSDCLPAPTELYKIAKHRLGHEEYISPERVVSLKKGFVVGHFYHQLLQWATLELGFCKPEAIERRGKEGWKYDLDQIETPVSSATWTPKPFHWVTGSADIAPLELPDEEPYIVDFKTMANHDYKQNDLPVWCANKYKCQLNIYMYLFNIDRGLIVAIQKDSPHEMKEFEYTRDQKLVDKILDKWKFVSECLEEDQAPSELDNDNFKLPLEN